MLRGLKHVTVDLEIEPPRSLPDDSDDSDDPDDSDEPDDEDPPETYALPTCKAITALCLAFIGASRLEQLTIKLTFIDPKFSEPDLAEVFWPLIFLRSNVLVRIEGTSGLLQREICRL